jgi:hypothetical protein
VEIVLVIIVDSVRTRRLNFIGKSTKSTFEQLYGRFYRKTVSKRIAKKHNCASLQSFLIQFCDRISHTIASILILLTFLDNKNVTTPKADTSRNRKEEMAALLEQKKAEESAKISRIVEETIQSVLSGQKLGMLIQETKGTISLTTAHDNQIVLEILAWRSWRDHSAF